MTRMGTVGRIAVTALLGLATILGLVLPGQADEAKTPINASLLLSIVSTPPTDRREAAFDESLKENGRAPLPPAGVVQPDGSVRYGTVSVTVKNPCPPDSTHYEAPPLPGRRARY
jgi:hypothetical protein